MNPADAVLLALERLVQAGVVIAVEGERGSGSGSLPEVVVTVDDPDPQARLPEIKALILRTVSAIRALRTVTWIASLPVDMNVSPKI
jgi:hypothetical protein